MTSSSCEMGDAPEPASTELDLVPQRETGMTAYEMMLSESQERMLIVADRDANAKYGLFKKWSSIRVIGGSSPADDCG